MTDILAMLATLPLFSGLPPRHLDAVARAASLRRISKGGILFHEGTAGKAAYLLVHGSIQAHKADEDGRERIIRIFRPGELFAQVILFERTDYPVTATAREASTVLVLPRRALRDLLDDAAFRTAFIAGLMARQRDLTNRIALLATPDVERRLRAFLADQFGARDRITCPLKRKEVAAAIGVTPETLSRLLTRLKRRGALVWVGREIRVRPAFWRGANASP